jgi:hypothetical protein
VMMYLLCSGLPVFGATLYVWHRHLTPDGNLVSGGFISMVARLFMYFVAALCGVMNCWHVVGGFVVASVFAWRSKATRAGFWAVGAGYGLLSGLLLLEAANAGMGPRADTLDFPIPRTVAVWVVPAVGAVIAAATQWAERGREQRAA